MIFMTYRLLLLLPTVGFLVSFVKPSEGYGGRPRKWCPAGTASFTKTNDAQKNINGTCSSLSLSCQYAQHLMLRAECFFIESIFSFFLIPRRCERQKTHENIMTWIPTRQN